MLLTYLDPCTVSKCLSTTTITNRMDSELKFFMPDKEHASMLKGKSSRTAGYAVIPRTLVEIEVCDNHWSLTATASGHVQLKQNLSIANNSYHAVPRQGHEDSRSESRVVTDLVTAAVLEDAIIFFIHNNRLVAKLYYSKSVRYFIQLDLRSLGPLRLSGV